MHPFRKLTAERVCFCLRYIRVSIIFFQCGTYYEAEDKTKTLQGMRSG